MAETSSNVRSSFLAVFLVVAALNLWIFRYFLVTGATAASVAVILSPLQQRLCAVLGGRRTVAAALMIALTTVLILLPLFSYAAILGDQAVALYEIVRPRLEPEALTQLWDETLPGRYPWLGGLKDRFEFDGLQSLAPALSQVASGANRVAAGAVTGLISVVAYLILFLLLLFFMLRDAPMLKGSLEGLLPFSESDRDEIFRRVAGTVKGVLYSMVIVPVVQGALAALGFWIFGLPSPIFWGTLVVFAAVIPGVGAPFVWVPAAIYLLSVEVWWRGAGLLVYGTLVIGVADNIIKPLLLRETAQFHPLLAFLAILGGILTFGPVGFLIGPVILSLLLSILRIHRMSLDAQPA